MSNTGFETFDTTIGQTNQLLAKIEEKYNWQNRRNQSYAALLNTLHALRDRLPLTQAVHLGAQLPMLVRGFYYEGWDPQNVPVKMNKEEFLQRIRTRFVYSLEEDLEELVKTVLTVILGAVSPGEVANLKSTLPDDIAALIEI